MGVVVVMTGALGLVTPPYGVCLLVASKIIGIHPRQAMVMTLMVISRKAFGKGRRLPIVNHYR